MSIAQVYAEGRLIRDEWAIEENGKQLLCLYTAMLNDPDARPFSCPARLCPRWLAYLLPRMDDDGSEEAWPSVVERVAKLAPHFGKLRPHVEWQVRLACAQKVMQTVTQLENDKLPFQLCQRTVELYERKVLGEQVNPAEFATVHLEAWNLVLLLIKGPEWESVESRALTLAMRAVVRLSDIAFDSIADAAGWISYGDEKSADRLHARILDLIETDLREQGII